MSLALPSARRADAIDPAIEQNFRRISSQWGKNAPEVLNVKRDVGAGGIGADDTSALLSAHTKLLEVGGGVMSLPAGTYGTQDSIRGASNVHIMGAGAGATKIQKLASENFPVLILSDEDDEPVQNASVSQLHIDGGWTDPHSDARGHGIRTGPQAVNCNFHDLLFTNIGSYGLGLQSNGAKHCSFHRIRFQDLGNEAVDLKNDGNDNWGNVFDTIWVERVGKSHEEAGDPAQPGEAGLDIRGQAVLSNIVVRHIVPTAGNAGVRFRHGLASEGNGVGGRWSALQNFYIDGDVGQTEGMRGIHILGPAGINVTNGTVRNVDTGVEVHTGSDPATHPSILHTVSGVHVDSCLGEGFRVREDVTDISFANCSANDTPTGFLIEGDRTTLSVPRIQNATTGIDIATTALDTDVIRPRYQSCTTTINDPGSPGTNTTTI